jgi:hypothetical protein
LHYSEPNNSQIARPLLLNVYSNANAMSYTYNPIPSRYSSAIVRGKPAIWAVHDPRPCIPPPDWSTSRHVTREGASAQAAAQKPAPPTVTDPVSGPVVK